MGENSQKNETNSSLDGLRERYKQRGESYNASTEYIDQDSSEVLTRTIAPNAYRFSGVAGEDLDEYKNGEDKGRKYMTGGDFASMYNSSRSYNPEPNVDFDSAAALKEIDQKRYGKKADENIKDKLTEKNRKEALRETLAKNAAEQRGARAENGYSLTEKENSASYKAEAKMSSFKEKAKKAYETWVPIEERKKEKYVEGKKTKMPKTIIFAIITIAFSLLLIVASTVMLTMAKMEQSSLEGELENLLYSEKLLREELDEKNSKLNIEDFAENELGMISRDYVDVEYIKSEKGDSLEIKEKDENTEFGFSAIFDIILSLFK